MKSMKKEAYVQPAVVKHELLRDITARGSGHPGRGPRGNSGFGRRRIGGTGL